MMYEPLPNRGGKTYQTPQQHAPGQIDPAALTDPDVLANFPLAARLTRPYGPTGKQPWSLNGLVATAMLPVAFKDKISQTITGPGYEYIVTGAASFTLAYPAASSDKTNAS